MDGLTGSVTTERRFVRAEFSKIVEGAPGCCDRCGAHSPLWDADLYECDALFMEALCFFCVEDCRAALVIAAQLGAFDLLVAVIRPAE